MSQAVETGEQVGDTALPRRGRSGGWWGVAIFVGGCLAGTGPISDNSLLTHLATGRLIRSGTVPHVDPYRVAGASWVVQSWLASWWYATLEALGGAGAIRLFTAVATGVLAALLWRLSRPADALLGRLALVGAACSLGLYWWTDRPQLIAYLLLAVVLVVLVEHRSAWWCLPLVALWVNVHGSWPVGLLILGAWCALEVLEQRWRVGRGVAVLAAALAGATLGALLSPYGADLLRFPFEMLRRANTLKFIREWRSPSLGSLGTWLFAVEVVLVGVRLWRRRAWAASCVAALLVVLAAMGVRNMAIASITLVALGAPYLDGFGSWRAGPVPSEHRRRVVIVASVCAMVGLIMVTPNYDLSPYPTRAVDWLEARGWVANPSVRLVTPDFVGNYLEWRYGTRANPWLDDRVELTSSAQLRDYVALLSDDARSETILGRYDPDLVLWMSDESLAGRLGESAHYRVVYRDGVSLVACRVGGSVPC